MKKESLNLLKQVDIAGLRGYDIQELLKHEIMDTMLYLTKDGMLRKPHKSELAQEIKKCLPSNSDQIAINEMNSAILIDFMTCCRKVPVKKLKLQTTKTWPITYGKPFKRISSNCGRINIIFDLCLDHQSIKQGGRMRRLNREVAETTILSIK